jgi:hypothetical protein
MPIEGGELKEVVQWFNSGSMARVGRRRAACTDSRDGSGWRRRKGEGRRWAGLGRKAEQSGSIPRKGSAGHKEDACQNVNGLQKLFWFFSKTRVQIKGFK